jgi:hypothetical protein
VRIREDCRRRGNLCTQRMFATFFTNHPIALTKEFALSIISRCEKGHEVPVSTWYEPGSYASTTLLHAGNQGRTGRIRFTVTAFRIGLGG